MPLKNINPTTTLAWKKLANHLGFEFTKEQNELKVTINTSMLPPILNYSSQIFI